jgi:hypothetical protein
MKLFERLKNCDKKALGKKILGYAVVVVASGVLGAVVNEKIKEVQASKDDGLLLADGNESEESYEEEFESNAYITDGDGNTYEVQVEYEEEKPEEEA